MSIWDGVKFILPRPRFISPCPALIPTRHAGSQKSPNKKMPAILAGNYDNKKCPEPESNQRHEDFQSSALPTELSGHFYTKQKR